MRGDREPFELARDRVLFASFLALARGGGVPPSLAYALEDPVEKIHNSADGPHKTQMYGPMDEHNAGDSPFKSKYHHPGYKHNATDSKFKSDYHHPHHAHH